MYTQKTNQKFVEYPEIPKYVIQNLNKLVGELKVTDHETRLCRGISIFKTRKGYVVLTWYQFYCRKHDTIQKCVDYKYASFRVKTAELYDVLKLHIMKFFDVNENGEYCYEAFDEYDEITIKCKIDEIAKQILDKLHEFVDAIINEKPFNFTIGEYVGCTFPSCYVHYILYTTFNP